MTLQNILIVGASGSVGSAILSVLQSDPTFTISVLTRKTSTANFPSSITVHTIDDAYPLSDLVKAFRGVDAVVNTVGAGQVSDEVSKRFVDAAIEVGVKRYIPSEFGVNTFQKELKELGDPFMGKLVLLEYLKGKEGTGLTWTGLATGSFLDWTFGLNFLDISIRDRHVTYWDDGTALFSCTTLHTTAVAVKNILLAPPEKTANKHFCISNFATNQRSIVASLEKLSGEKWTAANVSSEEKVRNARNAMASGDPVGFFDIIKSIFFTGKYGAHFEAEGEEVVANGLLGVPEVGLDEVVKEALEKCR